MFKGPFKASMFLHFIAQKLSVFPSRTENNQFIDHKHTEIIKQLNEISIKTQQRTSIVCDVLFFQEVNTFFFSLPLYKKTKFRANVAHVMIINSILQHGALEQQIHLQSFQMNLLLAYQDMLFFLQVSYKLSRSNRMRCYQRRNVGPGEFEQKKELFFQNEKSLKFAILRI